MARTRIFRALFAYGLGLLLSLPVGTLWHEVIGHGLTGIVGGGSIEQVEVLGLQLWPRIAWLGWQHRYGACEVDNLPSPNAEAFMALGGSLSTWLVALAATILLWTKRRKGWFRTVLVCLSLWWIDLLTYLLPAWGLPRSILWGQNTYSEPLQAAVALGIPAKAFKFLAVTACLSLAAALLANLRRNTARDLKRGHAPL